MSGVFEVSIEIWRITGINEWVMLPETEAALRAVEAERQLEDYLKQNKRLITVAGNVGMGKSTVTAQHTADESSLNYELPSLA